MEKYELSKEWITRNSEKIKKAYLLTTDPKCKYDITSVGDILKTIKIIDPSNATEENAEILSSILQLFVKQMKDKFTKKSKVKQKVIN